MYKTSIKLPTPMYISQVTNTFCFLINSFKISYTKSVNNILTPGNGKLLTLYSFYGLCTKYTHRHTHIYIHIYIYKHYTRFVKVCKAVVKRQTTLGNIYSSIRLDKQLGGSLYTLGLVRTMLKRLII